MKSPYTIDEQETIINVFPKSLSDTAEIWTCIPNMIEKIIRLHEQYPGDVSVVVEDGCANATVPRGWIKIQPKRKCTLSEEQKRANAERLAALRAAKRGTQKT